MQIFKKIPEELDAFEGEMIVSIVGEDERPLLAANAWLDWRLYGTLTELLLRNYFSGKLGEKCLLPTYGKFKFDRLLLLGGGNILEDTLYLTFESASSRWNEVGHLIRMTLESLKVQKVGLSLPRFGQPEYEKTALRCLQSIHLSSQTSFFVPRADVSYSVMAL